MLPPADPHLITVDRCTYVLSTYCTMCLTPRVPVRHNTQYLLRQYVQTHYVYSYTVNYFSPPTLNSITPDKQAVMHDLLFIDTDRLLVCARYVHWTTSTETHTLSSRVS